MGNGKLCRPDGDSESDAALWLAKAHASDSLEFVLYLLATSFEYRERDNHREKPQDKQRIFFL
eukprot:2993424-Rhodomonas_salina.2